MVAYMAHTARILGKHLLHKARFKRIFSMTLQIPIIWWIVFRRSEFCKEALKFAVIVFEMMPWLRPYKLDVGPEPHRWVPPSVYPVLPTQVGKLPGEELWNM